MTTRRDFLKSSGALALGAAALNTGCDTSGESQTGGATSVSGESAGMLLSRPEHPAPATFDRLSLEWHQNTVKRLQQKLQI